MSSWDHSPSPLLPDSGSIDDESLRSEASLHRSARSNTLTIPNQSVVGTRQRSLTSTSDAGPDQRRSSELALAGALKHWGHKHGEDTLGGGRGLYTSLSYSELQKITGDGESGLANDREGVALARLERSEQQKPDNAGRLSPGFPDRLKSAIRRSFGALPGLHGFRAKKKSTVGDISLSRLDLDGDGSDTHSMFDGEMDAGFKKKVRVRVRFIEMVYFPSVIKPIKGKSR